MGKNNSFICYKSTLNFKSIFISRYRQGMFCYCWAGTDASGTEVKKETYEAHLLEETMLAKRPDVM